MYEAVEQLARQMRPSESNETKEHVCLVKELKGAPGPTREMEGEVIFTVISEDGTTIRAKANLDPVKYKMAVVAHAAPHPVIVDGELHRVRRGYEIRKISDVQFWKTQETG
jgi:hypothetical protein